MKILAVDDDPIILELVKEFIGGLGDHTLIMATSADAALEHIEKKQEVPFDCFFIDIQMPGFDGIELTSRVRKQEHLRDVPIIMLTAFADKSFVDAAFSAGATDYVTKPFDAFDLRGRIALIEKAVAAKRQVPANTPRITQAPTLIEAIELSDPFSIFGVKNVIEKTALENYLMQLSRGAIFGSTTLGFAIRDIEAMHASFSPTDFRNMIAGVAKIVADCLGDAKFHMTYAGAGVFICVTDRRWSLNVEQIQDAVNFRLPQLEMNADGDGSKRLYVSVGRPYRFVWKSGQDVLGTIDKAYKTAEQAAKTLTASRDDFGLGNKIA